MRASRFLAFSALVPLAVLVMAQGPAPKLTIDQLVQIKHPSGHQWTPDGGHAWFTYDDGGINNVWAVATDGTHPAVQLTTYADGQTGAGGFWSRDGQTFFYQRGGGLLAVSVTGGAPHAAWPSAAQGSGFVLSPDGTRVAFIVGSGGGGARGGGGGRGRGRGAAGGAASPDATSPTPSGESSLLVHTIATDSDQQLEHLAGRLGGPSWSPDSSKLAYTTTAAQSTLVVADLASGAKTTVVTGDGPLGAPSWS